MGENIINNTTNKGSITRIDRDLLKLNHKKSINLMQKWAIKFNTCSSNDISFLPVANKHMKNAQHLEALGKCKSKLQ